MKADLLNLLACPACSGSLLLRETVESRGEIESGKLLCGSCAATYPILRYVPRFVPSENYAGSFGFQWNRFRHTQLDSHSGVPISASRFFSFSGWSPEQLRGSRVLDVGCGAGRFAEVALSTGAETVAIDYSSAVDACWENLGHHPGLHVVQADVYNLPFKPGTFDYVYCLGVLQHTPDVRKAFLSLPPQVKPGGSLAVDIYASHPLNVFWPKYWLRPLTRRMNQQRLFRLIERLVPWLLPISDALFRVPVLGSKLRYLVPVMNHRPVYPQLSRQQIREWAVLDTFDMFAPAYDRPQSVKTLASWFEGAGMLNVEVYEHGQVVGRGTRREAPGSPTSEGPSSP